MKCDSCNASIVWLDMETKNGTTKPHPFDAKPIGHGWVRFGAGKAKHVPIWRSHFASCPNAARHREPKP